MEYAVRWAETSVQFVIVTTVINIGTLKSGDATGAATKRSTIHLSNTSAIASNTMRIRRWRGHTVAMMTRTMREATCS